MRWRTPLVFLGKKILISYSRYLDKWASFILAKSGGERTKIEGSVVSPEKLPKIWSRL